MVRLLLVLYLPFFFTSEALFLYFNSSVLPSFTALNPSSPSPSAPSSSPSKSFLKVKSFSNPRTKIHPLPFNSKIHTRMPQEVLKAVSAKEQWDPEAGARVSSVDAESVRIGGIQSYGFHLRVDGVALILKFSEEAAEWRKVEKGKLEFGPDLVAPEGWYKQGIKALQLEGPLELHVSGGDDEISVHLPSVNITHQGLRRVLVGEGITIEVDYADEISFFYPYDIGFLMNGSSSRRKQYQDNFWPLGLPSCIPLTSVRVVGPTSLVAFRVRHKEAYIETSFPMHDTIELLPEKCYSNGMYKQIPSTTSDRLTSRLDSMERLMTSFLGKSIFRNRSTRLLRTRIISSKLLKFRVEVERDITENDRTWKKAAEWRTRPMVERTWFEIVGRFESGGGLKPVITRKLSTPLMTVESAAWSHLMSNISFTEFPSIMVHPEALTLDIKW